MWSPGVCGNGVQSNSVQCTVCTKKLIHKRSSGVCGDLVANGFRCRQCDETIQEADPAEDLMVDGEMYECVEFFVIWETLLMEMVEQILLLQLESEMDG